MNLQLIHYSCVPTIGSRGVPGRAELGLSVGRRGVEEARKYDGTGGTGTVLFRCTTFSKRRDLEDTLTLCMNAQNMDEHMK